MNAEIIAVGSELLTHQRIDTNSLFLTEELNKLGIELVAKCVVGDDRERLADAIRRAMGRSEVVILSGGLGPTEDDVTRDAAALALDRRLIFQTEVVDQMERRFRAMGRTMAEINRRQAFVIEGADMLPNDRGTAPGQWIEDAGRYLMLLPGPPGELKPMFTRQCVPRLSRVAPREVIRTLVLRVAGMPESEVDQLIAPIYTKFTNPVTTILAAANDIQVHLRARCATEAEAMQLLADAGGPIELLLGDRIYSRNGDPLEVVVGSLLKQHKTTLAVAESCTGGLLSELITAVPGSSEYFLGGLVTYSEALKIDLLGVSPEMLETHGAVSDEVAEAMAAGVRRRTGAGYALAVTGYAGPSTGAEKKPVGTVSLAVADAAGTRTVNRQILGDRERVRRFACHIAMDLLRRRMLGL
ncbi:MAG: competence/damage-inducible protein A [Bryobacterales bacterium]|jgi:nicotinamide-nucleotide amidase|nr:competence/damage-inducible protein A [Bryobacterales bacterium]